jgi:polar amino acid transport system permease protein
VGEERSQSKAAMESFFTMLQFLLPGLGVTISVTIIALVMGSFIGATMAVLRVYGGVATRSIGVFYSIVVRAIPVVVIIFILFFVIAEFIDLSPFMSGAVALGFASGAYQTEIFRGAILSVPTGQMVAARGIGMSRGKPSAVLSCLRRCGWPYRHSSTKCPSS